MTTPITKALTLRKNEKKYNPNTKQYDDNWVEYEKAYYPLGNVRQTYHETIVWEELEITPILLGDKFFYLGSLRFALKADGEAAEIKPRKVSVTVAVNIDSLFTPVVKGKGDRQYTEDASLPNNNKILSNIEKRLKVMALGLPDPEDDKEEEDEYRKNSEDGFGIPVPTKTTVKVPDKEANGNKQESKQIEDHQRIACAMLKNMGFKEEAEQATALQHIVQDLQIHAVSDLSRDHMFKFYQAMETLLGKKVDSGYKRTVDDYKIMRANYDKAMEVES